MRRRLWLAGAAALLLVAAPGATDSTAWGLPAGGSVVGGQATISSSNAQNLLIQQGTAKAIINWNSFSIAHGQSVLFQTPGSGSITLNRVTGGSASFLNGSLSSNGQVWIVNPNGVLIGSGAQINVAGLLLTTADIANNDFLSGNYNFGTASPNPNAGIVNRGDIQVQSGSSVVLAAPSVDNQGIVEATLGTIEVAGAKTFTVDFYGDKLLSFAVTGAVDQTPIGHDGQPVDALVSNSGTLAADGGQVLITARAAGNIIDNLINTTGIVQANSVSIQNGTVVFDAGDGGLNVGGTVSAAGQAPGTTGGTVQALGGTVTVASAAKIDVSGQAGGGTALIGGNFRGAGPQQNAQTTTVQAGAVIDADAVTSGNGGNVAVWSNGATTVNGTITARGGSQGGNGGYIETSGVQALNVDGATINTGAPNGAAGTWLLDPVSSGPDNLTITTATAIENGLLSGNVVVETTATGDYVNGSGLSGVTVASGLGDIDVLVPITWSSAFELTLSAYRSVNLDAAVTASGAGTLALAYNNNSGGTSSGGALNIASGQGSVQFTGSGGALTINGTSYTLIQSMAALQNIQNSLSGNYALAENLTATANFTPIGNATTPFTGTLNGLGNTVTSLTINDSTDKYVGVVGVLGGTVTNIGLVNPSVTGGAGAASGAVGALVGESESGSTITNSYAIGTGTITGGSNVGGLAGYSAGTIAQSYATEAVSGTGSVGGLIGWLDTGGSITASYATGAVSGCCSLGGLVGTFQQGNITQSYATGSVTGSNNAVGGLVGYLYNPGGTITQSYATGAVSGNDYVGGLLGAISGNTGTGVTVTQSYATGAVSGSSGFAGGLVGYNSGGPISSSYWDTQTTGQSSSAGGTPLTTAQFFAASSFAGFTFGTTSGASGWVIVDANGTLNNSENTAGATRPILLSEYSTSIANGDQLQLMVLNLAANYTLAADIDVFATNGGTHPSGLWTAAGFVPVGDASAFTGTLNGLGHTISDLTIDSATLNVGLFGVNSGTIENLALANVNVTGSSNSGPYVGALAGQNTGTITNSSSSGSVTGTSETGPSEVGGLIGYSNSLVSFSSSSSTVSGYQAGGLVGFNDNAGTIANSYATGNVSGTYEAGGLVGENDHSITNSHATGAVTITDSAFGGGLVGINWATITNSYATGAVTDSSATPQYDNVGGLAGYNDGSISQSYATGNVSGDREVGGLVGYNNYGSTITDSYASGTATVASSLASAVGGLVGDNRGSITASYSTGAVSGSGASLISIGGLIGYNDNSVTDSYAAGSVTGSTDDYIGGLVGYNSGSATTSYNFGAVSGPGAQGAIGFGDGSATDVYWDSTVNSSLTSPDAGGATGLTTAALQTDSLTTLGFSGSVWQNVAGLNNGRPSLIWQPAPPETVMGTVYSDRGFTLLPNVTIELLVNGTDEGTVNANSSGVYDFTLAPGTIPLSGAELLAYILSGGTGNAFFDKAVGSVSGFDIYSGYLRIASGGSNLSGIAAGLATALGSNSGSNFLFTVPSNLLTLKSGANLEIDSTAASLTIDQGLSASGSGGILINATALTLAADVTTAGGGVELNAPVTLAEPTVTITTNSGVGDGGPVTFDSTVDATTSGAQGLSIYADGSGSGPTGFVTFSGAVGGTTPLGAVYVSADKVSLAHNVTTNGGGVEFSAPVVLTSGFVTIDTTAGGANTAGAGVTFDSTIDATMAQSLAVNVGTNFATFNGAVGGARALVILDVTGDSTINTTEIKTTSTQTYGGTVTLGSDTTLTAATVTFDGSVDSDSTARALTISGAAVFNGTVGSNSILSNLAVTGSTGIATAAITTIGDQTYDGAVTLSHNAALTSSGEISNDPVTFGGTINAASAGGESLTVNSNAVFNGEIGGLAALSSLTVSGTSTIDTGLIRTTGTQNYDGAVTLMAPSLTIDTTDRGVSHGATVTFASTLDGAASGPANNLTIVAGTAGDVDFEGRVGKEYLDQGLGNTGQWLGAVTISSAHDVNLTQTYDANGDGFAADSFTVINAAALTVDSFISTNTGGNAGNVVIRTSGDVSIARDIFAGGGNGGPGNGNGGAVTIVAGGTVSIGAGLTTSDAMMGIASITAGGAGIVAAGHHPGNGGAVTVSGTSITLPFGVYSGGGDAIATGATANGGNAGAISLTATAGDVTIGSAISGDAGAVIAHGGDSSGGSGGAGADVTISGSRISLYSVSTEGGDSRAFFGHGDNNAGNITLIATASSGAAVTLYGNASSSTVLNPDGDSVTLLAAGGEYGDTQVGFDNNVPNGTFAGQGGNITIEGSFFGSALHGSSYVQLETATGQGGGSTVLLITASGSSFHGGTISVDGPVQGTTANTENLFVVAANGSADISGAVGSQVALGGVTVGFGGQPGPSLPFGGSQGNFTFHGSVNAALIVDENSAGSLTFDRALTAQSLVMAPGSEQLTLDGTATISDGAILSGTVTTSSLSLTAPITLDGNTTIDASGALTLGTVDGVVPATQSLTINDRFGAVTLGAVGDLTANNVYLSLDNVTISGASILLGDVLTAGTQHYHGPVTLAGNYVAGGGFSALGAITLGAATQITDAGTTALGAVATGIYPIELYGDHVSLNGAWSGTGARTILAAMPTDSIGLGDGATGTLTLSQAELTDLAGGAPSLVTISNNDGSGALTTGPGGFIFNAPLLLDPGSIGLFGTLTKASGDLSLVTTGGINGAVDLASGVTLTLTATSVDLTGSTINGASGAAAAANVATAGLTGAGPFTVNGVSLLNNSSTPNSGAIDSEVASLINNPPNLTPPPLYTPPPPNQNQNNAPPPDDFTSWLAGINPTAGGDGGGGNPGTVTLFTAAPSTDAPQTVAGIDTGGALFVAISPGSGAGGGQGQSGASNPETTLFFVSQPPPMKTVSHDQPPHPALTHPFVPGYINTVLFPNVPKGGVPGIKYNFSSSGNSGLW